jgi:SAM-dependent methyltransferase
MFVIAELYPKWRELKIHESSPDGPISAKLARECPEYLPTHFFADRPRGQIHNGFRCEDLMAQTFENESFDLVITSDVFEHLPDVARAVREIMRTLRPGGAHIFTVPWVRWSKTLARAVVKDGVLEHLEKPDYHGNPLGEGGSLVFTEWGAELPFLLQDWGKCPVVIHAIRDRSLGIDGQFPEVFVQQKPL